MVKYLSAIENTDRKVLVLHSLCNFNSTYVVLVPSAYISRVFISTRDLTILTRELSHDDLILCFLLSFVSRYPRIVLHHIHPSYVLHYAPCVA